MGYFATDYGIENANAAGCAVLEDSIMHKGRAIAAGSNILKNFTAPIDATVVSRLEEKGIKILGKTKMDEFGIAGLFPDAPREASGAVSAVADGLVSFALCNDYTGIIGQEAASKGLYYVQPTYGTVSRYGLIQAVPSMDQIGIVCKTPQDGFRILSIIAGHDPKDGAMYIDSKFDAKKAELSDKGSDNKGSDNKGSDNKGSENKGSENKGSEKKRLTVGIPKNIKPDEALSFIGIGINIGNDANIELATVEFEIKYLDVCAQVMQILCCAEISANISRYDGIKFGYRADGFADLQQLYTKSRTEGFGMDAKLAAILGAMVLSQDNYQRYYDKAMRIRRLIKDSLEFDKYDIMLIPRFDTQTDLSLSLRALPRLCGLPAVTMPFSGGSMTFIADKNREDLLYSILMTIKAAGQ